MSINYSFTIDNVNKVNSVGDINDVIISAQYTVKAWSGDKVSDSLGTTERYQYESELSSGVEFKTSELDSSSFIPFDQITKSVVIQWIADFENISDIQNHRDLIYVIDDVKRQIYQNNNQSTTTISGDNFTQSTSDIEWTPPDTQSKSETVTEEPEDPNFDITDPLDDSADVPA